MYQRITTSLDALREQVEGAIDDYAEVLHNVDPLRAALCWEEDEISRMEREVVKLQQKIQLAKQKVEDKRKAIAEYTLAFARLNGRTVVVELGNRCR